MMVFMGKICPIYGTYFGPILPIICPSKFFETICWKCSFYDFLREDSAIQLL